MATAKKKAVKVRDLKPAKDAKGGFARNTQNTNRQTQNSSRGQQNATRTLQ
jgi:hypothetical protein